MSLASLLRRRPVALDLALITAFVVWFWWPFLGAGLPPGDFGSFLALRSFEDRLVPTPIDFPTWNPWLMCGHPTIGWMSPFQILALPFGGLDPILRMKSVLVLFAVIAGLGMYALLHKLGSGKDAGLFGGLIYATMPHALTRAAVFGQIHLPMFYGLLPFFFLGLLRLGRRDARGVVVLALVTSLALVRDQQRTLLVAVMTGLVLAAPALVDTVRALRARASPLAGRWLMLLLQLAAALVLAVTLDAFELVNGFLGDPFKTGWRAGEQQYWIDRWSLDNVYSFFDRNGVLGQALGDRGFDFGDSRSRYVGLSLLALLLVGALSPRLLGSDRRRFLCVAALLPLSAWLSFGPSPLLAHALPRWQEVFASPAVAATAKAALAAAALLGLATAVVAIARNLDGVRRRWLLALLLAGAGVTLFVATPLFPAVQRSVFFLRAFRNPEWFQIAIASFAAVFPAALVVGRLQGRFGDRALWPPVFALLVLLAVADFRPYRALLTSAQRSASAVRNFRDVNSKIAEDAEDARVLSAESYSNVVDLGAVWHGKRLAWDFRSYSAPRDTGTLFGLVYVCFETGRNLDVAARLAGIANVKYIVDEVGFPPDLVPNDYLELVQDTQRLRVWRNRALRPWVQAWPAAALLVAKPAIEGAALTAYLATSNVAVVRVESIEDPALRTDCPLVFADAESAALGIAPAGAIVLKRDRLPLIQMQSFDPPPSLQSSRPAPERIVVDARAARRFLLVVSESFHPWWSATLDGRPAPLYPAEHAFLGVFVPPGEHRVELRFRRPWTYWLWGGVSLLALAGSLGFLVATRGAKRPEALV